MITRKQISSIFSINKWHFSLVCLFIMSFGFTSDVTAQKNKKPKLPYLANVLPADEIAKIYNKFDRFKYQIIGHFSNRDDVESGKTTEPLQEFIVMPIFQHRPGEFWVYLEFFSPDLLESPLDQRIEQYVQVSRDTFRMEVYYLKEPKNFINMWKEETFPDVDIRKDLIRGDGCDLIIAHQKEKAGTYRTVPPEKIECEMLTAKGAARYVDLEFELSDTDYLMWFHFFDAQKEHLKKTNNKGVLFRRLKEKEMGHVIKK